jgi:hypothetical protein
MIAGVSFSIRVSISELSTWVGFGFGVGRACVEPGIKGAGAVWALWKRSVPDIISGRFLNDLAEDSRKTQKVKDQ